MGNDYFTKTRSVASVRVFFLFALWTLWRPQRRTILKIGEEDILIVEVNDHSGPCEWNWSKISYVHSNTVGSTLVWHISCKYMNDSSSKMKIGSRNDGRIQSRASQNVDVLAALALWVPRPRPYSHRGHPCFSPWPSCLVSKHLG